jgi:hypothetical protein
MDMREPCLYCGTDTNVDEYFFEYEGALGWGCLCAACIQGIRVAVEDPCEEFEDLRATQTPSHDGWQPLSDDPEEGEQPFTRWLREHVLPTNPDLTIWHRR